MISSLLLGSNSVSYVVLVWPYKIGIISSRACNLWMLHAGTGSCIRRLCVRMTPYLNQGDKSSSQSRESVFPFLTIISACSTSLAIQSRKLCQISLPPLQLAQCQYGYSPSPKGGRPSMEPRQCAGEIMKWTYSSHSTAGGNEMTLEYMSRSRSPKSNMYCSTSSASASSISSIPDRPPSRKCQPPLKLG